MCEGRYTEKIFRVTFKMYHVKLRNNHRNDLRNFDFNSPDIHETYGSVVEILEDCCKRSKRTISLTPKNEQDDTNDLPNELKHSKYFRRRLYD